MHVKLLARLRPLAGLVIFISPCLTLAEELLLYLNLVVVGWLRAAVPARLAVSRSQPAARLRAEARVRSTWQHNAIARALVELAWLVSRHHVRTVHSLVGRFEHAACARLSLHVGRGARGVHGSAAAWLRSQEHGLARLTVQLSVERVPLVASCAPCLEGRSVRLGPQEHALGLECAASVHLLGLQDILGALRALLHASYIYGGVSGRAGTAELDLASLDANLLPSASIKRPRLSYSHIVVTLELWLTGSLHAGNDGRCSDWHVVVERLGGRP